MMTAPMIEWTLEVVEWVKAQLFVGWPEAKMRASAPELAPEGYRIRFRDGGRQYWLILSPDAIWNTSVGDVRSILEEEDWIRLIQNTGSISVGIGVGTPSRPVLNRLPTMEVKICPS